jgi:hypothetical protein
MSDEASVWCSDAHSQTTGTSREAKRKGTRYPSRHAPLALQGYVSMWSRCGSKVGCLDNERLRFCTWLRFVAEDLKERNDRTYPGNSESGGKSISEQFHISGYARMPRPRRRHHKTLYFMYAIQILKLNQKVHGSLIYGFYYKRSGWRMKAEAGSNTDR